MARGNHWKQSLGLQIFIRSDNGPPFTSPEFDAFLEYFAIQDTREFPTGHRAMAMLRGVMKPSLNWYG